MRSHGGLALPGCLCLALASFANAATYRTVALLTPLEAGVTASSAVGVASVTVDDVSNSVTVATTYYGLTSTVTNSHFHSGVIGTNGGVLVPVGNTSAGSGIAASASAIAMLLNGSAYFNVHTTAYPSGELRGQVAFGNVGVAVLTGVQETVAVTTAASGFGSVLLNDATGTVTVTSLVVSNLANGTAAHIHGPASPGSNAGVVCGIAASAAAAPFTGPVSNLVCPATYTAPQLAAMRAGSFYFNVHTSQNGGGEIRGQIFFPSTFDTSFILPVIMSNVNASATTAGAGSALVLRQAGTPIAPAAPTTFVAFGAVSGLSSAQTNAHLHGLPSRGVYAALPPTASAFAYAPLQLTAAQALDLVNNRTYFNIHTVNNPSGEISGAVSVPTGLGPLSCPTPTALVTALASNGLNVLSTALGASPITVATLTGLSNSFGGGVNSLTVFAPTDAAFAALLAKLPAGASAANLTANATILDMLLTYHALGSYVTAPSGAVATVQGMSLNVNGTVITSAGSTANIIGVGAVNIASCQIVVHTIDAVLLPAPLATLSAMLFPAPPPSMPVARPPPSTPSVRPPTSGYNSAAASLSAALPTVVSAVFFVLAITGGVSFM